MAAPRRRSAAGYLLGLGSNTAGGMDIGLFFNFVLSAGGLSLLWADHLFKGVLLSVCV